jgi:outer membrane protein assembly factor BamB
VEKDKKTILAISLLTVFIYTGAIVWWHLYAPQQEKTILAPGADNRPEGLGRLAEDIDIGRFFMRYVENPPASSLTGRWTTFRGAAADNIIRTTDPIIVPEADYPVLWHIETGEGYAAPAIYNGRFFLLDYIEDLSSDALRAFDLETGVELWRRWYRLPIRRNHGFSRTVPAVGENFVVTIGPQAHVMVCDPDTGEMLWYLDMINQFGTEIPGWYTAQCPLVDDGVLILAPGGDEVLMLGADVMTGEILWTVPNTLNIGMSHSSIMPLSFDGKKTYVYFGIGGVVGVSAEGNDKGTLLWSTSQWQPTPTTVAPSPLQVSATDVLLTAGYGTGGARLRVNRSGNNWTATIVEQYLPEAGLSSEQQTPILFNNMIISKIPTSGNTITRRRLVMYSPNDFRNHVWVSNERFLAGLGPYIVINNYLFALNDDGELFVYEIEARSMRLLKRQVVFPDGADAWGPLAYADGILIVGDNYNIKGLKITQQ